MPELPYLSVPCCFLHALHEVPLYEASTLEFTPALVRASDRWEEAIAMQALTPGSMTYQLLGFGQIAVNLCAVIGSFMTWDGASLLGSC